MARVSAPADEGVGLIFPERESDYTGTRPSWYPFQIECVGAEDDDADPEALTSRERELPDPPLSGSWETPLS